MNSQLRLGLRYRVSSAFTIVELLIVVVIIAVLAAITIVSYNGIVNNAKDTTVKADLATAVKQLETYRYTQNTTEQYPTTQTAAGFKPSAGTTLMYTEDASTNTYCLTATNGTSSYHATSTNKTTQSGACGTDSLLGWWKLNGDASDASGNNATGTINGATPTTGQNGATNGAYSFSSSGNIRLPNINIVGISYTASAWVQVSSFSTTQGTYGNQVPIFGDAAGTSANDRNLQLGVRWGTPFMGYYGEDWSVGSPTLTTGQWYFIVFIGNMTGMRQTYVNGVLVGTTGIMGVYAGTGLSLIGANCCMSGAFSASIDDVRIFNRVLSASEIQALYASGAQ